MQITDTKGAFSIDEFCAWASIGRSKFYLELRAGRVKMRKVGRKSVITVLDAQHWLAELPEVHLGEPR